MRIAGIEQLSSVKTHWLILAWASLVVIGAVGRLTCPTIEMPLFYDYCSPIQLLQATLLFVLFTRMQIKSRAVNWLAGSGLAVFVFHTIAPIFNLWSQYETNLYYTKSGCFFVILSFFLCFAVFLTATLFDKIRGWVASPILCAYDKWESKWQNKKIK